MSIGDIIRILRRGAAWVVGGAVLGLAIALGAAALMPKTYEAHTSLYFTTTDSTDAAALSQGAQYIQSQIRSYPLLITAPEVLRAVAEETGVPLESVANQVSAEVPTDSAVLNITTTDHDPEQAAALATAFGTHFAEEAKTLETRPGAKTSPIRVTVVAPASAPAAPSKPNVRVFAILGVAVGVLIGFLLAVLRDATRRS